MTRLVYVVSAFIGSLLTSLALPQKAWPSVVGANATALFTMYERGQTSRGELEATLAQMRASGVTVVRTDPSFSESESVRGQINWSHDDFIAYELRSHGLGWLAGEGDTAPGWASNTGVSEGSFLWDFGAYKGWVRVHFALNPRYVPDLAAWWAMLARRYHPWGIEPWNEPDIGFYWFNGSVALYEQLYERTQDAVHAAAPGVQVLAFSASPRGAWLIGQVQRENNHFHPDAISVHEYADTPALALTHLRSFQTLAARYDVPLYVTEYGWDQVHEPARDSTFRPMLEGFAKQGVAGSFYFTWGPPENDYYRMDDPDQAAFLQAVRAQAAARPLAQVSTHHPVHKPMRRARHHTKRHHRRHARKRARR